MVLMSLQAGSDGYLLKQTKATDLRAALVAILCGGAPMTNQIARCVIESFRQKARLRDESKYFTTRGRANFSAALSGLFKPRDYRKTGLER